MGESIRYMLARCPGGALAGFALVMLLSIPGKGYAQTGRVQDSAPPQNPIVIVELFTSEGCSSCPPADELIRKLSEQQPFPGVEVVALEEHVDYWNSYGWTDPFSSSEFTNRQVAYSQALPKSGVYTPQMIVDGYAEIAGSRIQQLSGAIQRARLAPKAEVKLSASGEKDPGKASFEVKVDHLPDLLKTNELELWVAVTEKGLYSEVKGGENSGETLRHAAIVRSLRKVGSVNNGAQYANQFTVKLEMHWKRENLVVVAFIVDKHYHKIVGAGIAPVT
jgi:hypothetical protein